jgi:hypothetical protein
MYFGEALAQIELSRITRSSSNFNNTPIALLNINPNRAFNNNVLYSTRLDGLPRRNSPHRSHETLLNSYNRLFVAGVNTLKI